MQKIDRDRLDENTGQIECGEEIGTVFLIDKETAITVKHCLLIEKPETYAKNAVLHFSVKDEEKTVNATVISEDNDSSEDLVVLRCEESIDVQPLYLFSAELDVFDELQMVGYGKSFGFEKRWIQLKNTNLLKKTNKNMILDTIDSAAMDYEGFSGSLIADYNNCIVGIANMQNTEKGKANSLLGISVKNRKKFFENNNIPELLQKLGVNIDSSVEIPNKIEGQDLESIKFSDEEMKGLYNNYLMPAINNLTDDKFSKMENSDGSVDYAITLTVEDLKNLIEKKM